MKPLKACNSCQTKYDTQLSRCPKCGSTGYSAYASLDAGQALEAFDALARGDFGMTHGDRGGRLYQQGDLRGARAEFEQQLAETPHSAVAHSNLGIVIYELGDRAELDEAIRLMEAALSIAPSLDGVGEYLEKAKRKRQGSPSARTAAHSSYQATSPNSELRFKPWWKFW